MLFFDDPDRVTEGVIGCCKTTHVLYEMTLKNSMTFVVLVFLCFWLVFYATLYVVVSFFSLDCRSGWRKYIAVSEPSNERTVFKREEVFSRKEGSNHYGTHFGRKR